MGHPVIMGLGTWRSFHERCLPGRRNIVVTDQPLTEADRISGAEFFSSPDEALEAAGGSGEIFIIGGGMMYRQMIDLCDPHPRRRGTGRRLLPRDRSRPLARDFPQHPLPR